MRGKRNFIPCVAVFLLVTIFVYGVYVNLSNVGSDGISTFTEESKLNDHDHTWIDTPLIDVNTGETFTLSDFEGKTVLLESFAVWCPICRGQQETLKEFHSSPSGQDVISVAINVDPNENNEVVKQYSNANGFDWRFVVADAAMTQRLIDEFGTGVINPPSVPIIMICPDLDHRKLGGFGARSANKLQEEIAAGC